MLHSAAVAARIATSSAGSMEAIASPVHLPRAKGWTATKAKARGRVASDASRRLSWAQVAQLVEHATENRSVGGSIPPLGTITPSIAIH